MNHSFLERIKLPLLFLAVVISLTISFYWYLLQPPKSIQAYVNAAVTTVQAPMAGRLLLSSGIDVGKAIHEKTFLGSITSTIENPRTSELRVQSEALQTQLDASLQRQRSIRDRASERLSLLETFAQENNQQKHLQLAYAAAGLQATRSDADRLLAESHLAEVEAHRANLLFAQGDVSQETRDQAVTASIAAKAKVATVEAALLQSRAVKDAAAENLQIDGARSLSYVDIRVRELQAELNDLRLGYTEEAQHAEALRRQMRHLDHELHLETHLPLPTPIDDGVIWSIDAQNGESIAEASPILEIINCKKVWIEAFFDEKAAMRLHIGQIAHVQDVNGKALAIGRVQTIRAGAGRVTIGRYIVDPPPEIEHRQLPVRVSTVRMAVDWPNGALPQSAFCRAGSSVNVIVDGE